eukprot:comp22240_c0_seq1/m.52739 comp22240_c0_seq1/g.52739  ORF comp22240_c0_seq1/g.52739 comp22240_c0_seq1/m.52739 type:complete len:300 (+) comp22240_c0_seq1:2024-2923(+)
MEAPPLHPHKVPAAPPLAHNRPAARSPWRPHGRRDLLQLLFGRPRLLLHPGRPAGRVPWRHNRPAHRPHPCQRKGLLPARRRQRQAVLSVSGPARKSALSHPQRRHPLVSLPRRGLHRPHHRVHPPDHGNHHRDLRGLRLHHQAHQRPGLRRRPHRHLLRHILVRWKHPRQLLAVRLQPHQQRRHRLLPGQCAPARRPLHCMHPARRGNHSGIGGPLCWNHNPRRSRRRQLFGRHGHRKDQDLFGAKLHQLPPRWRRDPLRHPLCNLQLGHQRLCHIHRRRHKVRKHQRRTQHLPAPHP